MPRRNHSHRLHASFESPGTHATGGDEDYEEDAGPTMGTSEQGGQIGAFVERNATATVLASFGFGFGLGLFVTLLMTRGEPNWFERYAPEAMQDLPNTLKHLPERIKHMPESFASYLPSSWKRS